ncbi:putative transcriptional regulatory protein C1F7.11c [Mycena sanguinolenta]|uniref:Putative transcriptional regulatory protein C1F7.11c n=1 Tax=Mycena sanguinolenta TaxID=230812 RepID=A0A8H6XJM5_9AGAR|nr:putative transcriptional regulatory protein C1F7.11c [Mycena sanguinolenta]
MPKVGMHIWKTLEDLQLTMAHSTLSLVGKRQCPGDWDPITAHNREMISRLFFRPIHQNALNSEYQYQWMGAGRFPVQHKHYNRPLPLDDALNQTVFIHGYSISVCARTSGRLFPTTTIDVGVTDIVQSQLGHSTRRNSGAHSQGVDVTDIVQSRFGSSTGGNFRMQAQGSSSFSSRMLGFWTGGAGSSGRQHAQGCKTVILSDFPHIPNIFHPGKLINEYLLHKVPEAVVAMTHDDDWVDILAEDPSTGSKIQTVSDFFEHIDKEFSVSEDDGLAPRIAFLVRQQLHQQNKESMSDNQERDNFTAVLHSAAMDSHFEIVQHLADQKNEEDKIVLHAKKDNLATVKHESPVDEGDKHTIFETALWSESAPLTLKPPKKRTSRSCSECRRLKLRCTRVFPCRNCVNKGCAAICPDGSLTTGNGNRFVLADTEVLHNKIDELSNRVRQLEDGLAQSHSLHSLQPHPLLTPELLNIKRPSERPDTATNEGVDAMGSLSISEGGRSTFFGQAANSWYLLQNERGSGVENEPLDTEPAMHTDVPRNAIAFPFSTNIISTTEKDIRQNLINLLPRTSVAKRYTPINESDFYETIFGPIYDDTSGGSYASVTSHCLAVLYMVLALGTLVDLDMPPYPQATKYYQLSRAALAIDSVLEEPSIAGIQALALMCHYMLWADIKGPRWVLMGLVTKLVHSVGLHRDGNLWNLDPSETFRRRCLVYEIYTYDLFESLTFGRPPSFSSFSIDTKLPHESSASFSTEDGMLYAAWKHRWSYECLSVVHDRIFGARSPPYSTVQELDQKVRADHVPPSLQIPGFVLFYMHRGFFAQALQENPADPMSHEFAPSVMAAYTSACTYVGLIESLFKQHPALTERMWFYFMHVFSCAIVLGSVAIKPQMALAPSALSPSGGCMQSV